MRPPPRFLHKRVVGVKFELDCLQVWKVSPSFVWQVHQSYLLDWVHHFVFKKRKLQGVIVSNVYLDDLIVTRDGSVSKIHICDKTILCNIYIQDLRPLKYFGDWGVKTAQCVFSSQQKYALEFLNCIENLDVKPVCMPL